MIDKLIWQHAYLTTLYLAAIISLTLAIYAWIHRSRPEATLFSLMMLSTSVYILFNVLLLSSTSPERTLSLVHLFYFLLTIMLALFLSFVILYTGNGRWLNRYTIPIIGAMPILTQIIVVTNDYHHCFIKEMELSQNGILLKISTVIYGNCYWLHTAYSYILLLIAMILLIRFSIRSFSIYKVQSITLLIAVLIPILGSLHDARLFNNQFTYPFVPVCFSIMGVLLAWNLFRNKMLNVIPIARDTLIESMSDCLFVLDPDNHVIDINASAISVFDLQKQDIISHSGEQIFQQWPELLNRVHQEQETEVEISIVRNGKRHYFDVKVSPVKNKFNMQIGKMVVLRDITQRVLSQIEVQNSLQRINELKEELYRISIRDPLTGMYNRRYLDEILPREIVKSNRSDSPISFIMMDIDYFKLINDTYGHKVGDQVLVFLSKFFHENIRMGDLVFRYGGEEFLALLLNLDIESAKRIVERWQNELSSRTTLMDGEEVRITISIGLAEYRKDGMSYQEVIQAADTALYQAKANGRNCISVYDSYGKKE